MCFERAEMFRADLSRTWLVDTAFINTILIEANLEWVKNGRWAKFIGADMRSVKAKGANFPEADFTRARISERAYFGSANLSNSTLTKTNFSTSNLEGANLYRAKGTGTIFHHVRGWAADFSEAVLVDMQAQGANFREAVFVSASIPAAKLQRTILYRANLFNATCSGCVFDRTNLQEADLREADLRGSTGLSKSYLHLAKYNSRTQFPLGFDPKKAGMINYDEYFEEDGSKSSPFDKLDGVPRKPFFVTFDPKLGGRRIKTSTPANCNELEVEQESVPAKCFPKIFPRYRHRTD